MFGLFKKKNAIEKLQDKHKKLLEEAFKLSKSNRSASDQKQFEAQQVLEEIEALQKK
jgi:hypothetical protein